MTITGKSIWTDVVMDCLGVLFNNLLNGLFERRRRTSKVAVLTLDMFVNHIASHDLSQCTLLKSYIVGLGHIQNLISQYCLKNVGANIQYSRIVYYYMLAQG